MLSRMRAAWNWTTAQISRNGPVMIILGVMGTVVEGDNDFGRFGPWLSAGSLGLMVYGLYCFRVDLKREILEEVRKERAEQIPPKSA